MFESAELGHQISRERYDAEVPPLREKLLTAQYELVKRHQFSAVILIGGVDGAGKGETINVLNEWMDPRHIQTTAFAMDDGDLHGRPEMWRYWKMLPPNGKIGLFAGSWYSQPITQRAYGQIKNAELDRDLELIRGFERMLTDEGVLLLKFWFHLSKDRQKRRLKALSRDERNAWRVGELEWKHFELYDEFAAASVRALRETSTGNAPWTIVEGTDRRYRELTVGTSVLGALSARLQRPADAPVANTRAAPLIPALDGKNVLSALDYSTRMPREEYERELEEKQGRLNMLTRRPRFKQHSVVVVFEGSDAAGKGGAVRRLTRALDARQYQVIPIAAPTDEERARPYLWRFWRHLPERGRFTVFDRSWYGRVLVERVEGYCSESDWMRAYTEINDFEEQLVQNHTIVVKLWLQITPEEQLRRFEERKNTPFKQHKITEDDWRNRAKADEYTEAVCDMIDRTSTELAPWNLIPADDKLSARIRVLDVIHRNIREALE